MGNQLEVMISFLSAHIYTASMPGHALLHASVRIVVFFPYVRLSIHGGDRPLLIVGLGLN